MSKWQRSMARRSHLSERAAHDAVARESQDLCDGHPAITTYHYHNIPSCIRNASAGPSTVVGWAWDGFPIVAERDASGALPHDRIPVLDRLSHGHRGIGGSIGESPAKVCRFAVRGTGEAEPIGGTPWKSR